MDRSIPLEIKSFEEDGSFECYGATYDIDLGGDRIERGAFQKSLAETDLVDIHSYFNHDTDHLVAEYTEVREDEKGLYAKGKLFIEHIEKARETHFLMKKRKLKAFSIIYKAVKSRYEKGIRVLEEIKLKSIDPVFYPMNPKAGLLSVKSGEFLSKRDLEAKLRDAGMSKQEAKALIADGWKGLKRDADDQKNKSDSNQGEEGKSSEDWNEVTKFLRGQTL